MSLFSEYTDIDEYSEDYLRENYFYYSEETLTDVFNNCILPSVFSAIPAIANIVLLNFAFGCIHSFGLLPKDVSHILIGSIGIYLLNTLESDYAKFVIFLCFIISLVLFYLSYFLRRFLSVHFLLAVFVTLLVVCEYHLIDTKVWLQIRGIVMVLVMKMVSLADVVQKTDKTPNIIEYFGYTLCGANVMLGPWVSFDVYLNYVEKKPEKKNIFWVASLVLITIKSIFFLTLSNCWVNFFITEDSNRWFIAYKEALAFRSSHYFISYLAEAGMVASAFFNQKTDKYRFIVTEPLEIEFPSSLSVVVRKWNQPMHDFLKKYVYRSFLRYGKFYAILTTFLISSFLHGLEVKVSVILVSLGIFSYLQVVPRNKISETFDCCVKVRPCKNCNHKYKRNDMRVKVVLFLYSLVTIFHLAYLGILMDPSTDEVGIYEKWQNLSFVSHIVMFFNMLFVI